MGERAMKSYVLLVDVDKCTQCYNCVLSCKDEHFGNEFLPISTGCQELGQNWLDIKIEERGGQDKILVSCWPEGCRHCEDPECARKSDAVYKREDGIVIMDPVKAKGQKELLGACPYHAVSWNSEKGLAQKCTMCAHLLDNGETQPRCVEACPTTTLVFGDANDPQSQVSKIIADHDELKAQTGIVRYFNKTGRIVTGSVYLSEKEVAEAAEVRLLEGDKVTARTVTNGFGDFVFKNLPEGRAYTLQIEHAGFPPQVMECNPEQDFIFQEIYLGQ
jgi:Fe-S-cluster-containing dehydrogenase component